MENTCNSSSFKARALKLNVIRAAGNVELDHHLVDGKVGIKHGRSPSRRQEEVRSVRRFETLKEKCYSDKFRNWVRERWLVQKKWRVNRCGRKVKV